MHKQSYGVVRYVNDYTLAPGNAEYIVRRSDDGSILLEQYTANNSHVLCSFPFDYYTEEKFREVLVKFREIIGCSKCMWVERPSWLYSNNELDFWKLNGFVIEQLGGPISDDEFV